MSPLRLQSVVVRPLLADTPRRPPTRRSEVLSGASSDPRRTTGAPGHQGGVGTDRVTRSTVAGSLSDDDGWGGRTSGDSRPDEEESPTRTLIGSPRSYDCRGTYR